MFPFVSWSEFAPPADNASDERVESDAGQVAEPVIHVERGAHPSACVHGHADTPYQAACS